MDWNQSIDQYCERIDSSFWSEPVNFTSNLAFIFAAWALWRVIKRAPTQSLRPGSRFLVGSVFCIGIGSSLFHSIANAWSMWADVIPISIFLIAYLYCFFRWVANLSSVGVFMGLVFFAGITAILSLLADKEITNGSEAYFGVWTALFGITCYSLGRANSRSAWQPAVAAIIFSISLYFRTIDMRVCAHWPTGTHFYWHTLNAVVLFLITRHYATKQANALH